jgi:HSP20 family protein
VTLSGRDVLLVGQAFHGAQVLTDRLHRWGFRCHFASNMRAASDLLSSHPVALVLSESVPWNWLWPPDGFGRTADYGIPTFARRKQLLLAARHRRRESLFGIASSATFGVCEHARRNNAVFSGRAVSQSRFSSSAKQDVGSTEREKAMTHHTDLNLVSVHELFEHTQDVYNLIARRAFEIFESRGHTHGNDREDWFRAESELLTPVKFHLSVSGEQLTARAEVPGFSREEIKISVEPRRLSISGKTKLHENHQSGKHAHSVKPAQLMFRVIDLPTEVNLSKARATFSDDTIEVVMPKAAPAKSVRVETNLALSA